MKLLNCLPAAVPAALAAASAPAALAPAVRLLTTFAAASKGSSLRARRPMRALSPEAVSAIAARKFCRHRHSLGQLGWRVAVLGNWKVHSVSTAVWVPFLFQPHTHWQRHARQ